MENRRRQQERARAGRDLRQRRGGRWRGRLLRLAALALGLLVWLGIRAGSGPVPDAGGAGDAQGDGTETRGAADQAAAATADRDPEDPEPRHEAADAAGRGDRAEAGAGQGTGAAGAAGVEAAAPGPATAAEPETRGPPRRAVEDRLAGILASVDAAQSLVDLRRAAVGCVRAAELPLDGAQRGRLVRAVADLRVRLAARLDQLAALAGAGDVVAQRREWEAAVALGEDPADPAGCAATVRAVAEAHRWPWPLVAAGGVPAPATPPFARGDVVRARLDGVPAAGTVGRVVAVRGTTVTLRVEDGAGLRFPSVDWSACAPVTAGGAEAAALARHAAARGLRGVALSWAAAALAAEQTPLDASARDELRSALGR